MTREEAITELTIHLEHWERLKKEHIASVEESDRTIEALNMAMEALSADAVQEAVPTVVRVTMSNGSQYYLEHDGERREE